jgi:hypothetical protein
MKKAKKKEWHASPNKIGMGDYYGTAIKNQKGRIISDSMGFKSMTPGQLKKPPKSLA